MHGLEASGQPEDRAVYLREHRAGRFIDAVGDTRHGSIDTVMLTVAASVGEPETLYVALDYTPNSGVTITVAPAVSGDRSRPSV